MRYHTGTMISLLRGTIAEKNKDSLVLMTAGGVGYEVRMTLLQLAGYTVGTEVTLYTYLKITDSSHDLFGFATNGERAFFSLLMTVSGVGPKTAMNILSLGSIEQIQNAIGAGDVKYLTAVSGLGAKTAERLVVELKGKIVSGVASKHRSSGAGDIMGEVIDALISMGYSRDEAKRTVETLDSEGKTTEEVLRLALKRS